MAFVAVREHVASKIVGVGENGFAFLVGKRLMVLPSQYNASYAVAQEFLDIFSHPPFHGLMIPLKSEEAELSKPPGAAGCLGERIPPSILGGGRT